MPTVSNKIHVAVWRVLVLRYRTLVEFDTTMADRRRESENVTLEDDDRPEQGVVVSVDWMERARQEFEQYLSYILSEGSFFLDAEVNPYIYA